MSILIILLFAILCVSTICFNMFTLTELSWYGAGLILLWMILHIIVELVYKLYKGGNK